MDITITYGSGDGGTTLSAFDKALYEAGLANYNLITLSSVIPTGARVITKKITEINQKEYGYKLYLVMARAYAVEPGKEAWAGIGWVNHVDGSGKGLFVEHEGGSEKEVITMIKESLTSMGKYRPEERGDIHYQTCGIKCKGKPVCAVVGAVYKSEGWDDKV